jgi:hypothetical protein
MSDRHPSLGFDTMEARRRLVQELVSLKYAENTKVKKAFTWQDAWLMACAHHMQHTNGSCLASNCRGEALSMALFELCAFAMEVDSEPVAMMKQLDDIDHEYVKLDRKIANLLPAIQVRANAEEQSCDPRLRDSNAWLELSITLKRMRLMRSEYIAGLELLRSRSLSSQMARRPSSTRPAELLKTAVWQQLKQGDYSAKEIAELVPDNLSKLNNAMIRRVRERLKSGDVRSFRW